MKLHHVLLALRRLNDLQCKPLAPWVSNLSEGERSLAIELARRAVPTSILGHHDRLVALRKKSLAQVHHGVCGSCHMKLLHGHHHSSCLAEDLDVCDHCGVFLEWPEPAASSSSSAPVQSKIKSAIRRTVNPKPSQAATT